MSDKVSLERVLPCGNGEKQELICASEWATARLFLVSFLVQRQSRGFPERLIQLGALKRH